MKRIFTIAILFVAVAFISARAQTRKLVVNASQPKADIQPTMWGIFYEDINFAADGGLYAEMIKNRSFEFDAPMMGWVQPASDRHSMNENSGMATVIKNGEEPNNHFIRIEVNNDANYKLINEGFRGMGVKEGENYNLSFKVRKVSGDITAVSFELLKEDGSVITEKSVSLSSNEWKEYSAQLQSNATEPKAKLRITFEGNGVVEMDMISLFPEDTWMGRENGLRKDLVQLLADLDPGFLRFPGGCIVEGRTLAKRYQWKKTVGDLEDREMIINRWNTEFSHRLTPDYFQSFGLGFFEYFLLSEDIGAEPLPILSCGMACQFNTGELVPMDELDPYVQDALDLIEFANGPVNSPWGKVRADMGHPEPFNMKYIGIGNEQWGPDYFERYKVFEKALKEKYPEIIIVSTTGPFPDGEHFEYAEKQLHDLKAELVDEHYYRSPEWFRENADRYDDYRRDSYKVFAGEYAAQSVAIASPDNKNNWECALSEAAYMTGLERNADVVHLTSYAPLFAHVDAWQWTPDMIWFDNLGSFGTPNYYVQKMFSTNKGTKLISIQEDDKDLIGQGDLYASAVVDEENNEVIVKVVNTSDKAQSAEIAVNGLKLSGEGNLLVMASNDLEKMNSLQDPKAISPQEESVEIKGKKINLDLAPYSLNVVKVKIK